MGNPDSNEFDCVTSENNNIDRHKVVLKKKSDFKRMQITFKFVDYVQ